MISANNVLVFLILTNLALLGSSRLGACIRLVAIQGAALGLLPLLAPGSGVTLHAALLAAGTAILKGGVFPWLLLRALRQADVRREVEPLVGYGPSLAVGVGALAVAMRLGARLPAPIPLASSLLVPAAFFSIFVGLFLLIGRRTALMQALGYLVLENGVYTYGVVLVSELPALVELGILLDVFLAVFVMGIAIDRINREFDHIDADRLNVLKG
jgi:hydrogenase-4 component E